MSAKPITFNIYYGTCTNTAKKFASETHELLLQNNYSSRVRTCNSFNKAEFLKQRLIIVFCANTGSGKPADTAKQWWAWFSTLKRNSLPNTNFAVFGLGNKAYPTYNNMGLTIDARFAECGATRFIPFANSDSSEGKHQEHFRKWLAKFPTQARRVYTLVENDMKKRGDAVAAAEMAKLKKENAEKTARMAKKTKEKAEKAEKAETLRSSEGEFEVIPEVEVIHATRGLGDESVLPQTFVKSTGSVLVGPEQIRARRLIVVAENDGSPLHSMMRLPPTAHANGIRNSGATNENNPDTSENSEEAENARNELRCVVVGPDAQALITACDEIRKLDSWKIVATLPGQLTEETGKMAAELINLRQLIPVTVSFTAALSPQLPSHDERMEHHVLRKVPIVGIRGLCPDQSLKAIQLNVIDYHVAGTVEVRPQNLMLAVRYFAQTILRVSDDVLLKAVITNLGGGDWPDVPTSISLRECLEEYVDLGAGASRAMMRQLKPFLPPRALQVLADHAELFYGSDEKDAKGWRLSLCECFQLLGNPAIPVDAFLSSCEPMAIRHYSIASSPKVAELEFAFKMVEHKLPPLEDYSRWNPQLAEKFRDTSSSSTPNTRTFRGLCSTFLALQCHPGGVLTARFSQSVFEPIRRMLESEERLPLLMMVGNGTGIATFMGILQELLAREENTMVKRKKTWCCGAPEAKHSIVYGCRNKNSDWIYRHQMESFGSVRSMFGEEGIGRVYLVFSQMGHDLRYVQHELQSGEAAAALRDLCSIGESGYLLLCGSPQMIIEVQQVLLSLKKEFGADRMPEVLVEAFG